jgi:hypothetical protein
VDEEKMQPNDAAKIIMPFDEAAIRAGMAKLLSSPKCGEYVKRLLDIVSRNASPGNTLVASGDVMQVFDMVLRQKGLVRAGDTAHGAIGGANFADGSIKGGNAMIQVGNVRPGLPVTREELEALYIESDVPVCLHETLHHCGELVYSDQEYAIAASSLNGNNPPLPTPPAELDSRFLYSQYWDTELRKSFK